MTEQSINFLMQLLSIPGTSGDEVAVAHVWRENARSFADEIQTNVHGSSLAILNAGLPRVLLAGHIDEIGLMINYIDDNGYLYFSNIGGCDPQVLVGQCVRLLGKKGDVIGVIGKKPIHFIEEEERSKASKIKELWIDIGAKNRNEANEYIRVGSVGVIEGHIHKFPNGRIMSRSLDNRVGAFIVLEVLRILALDRPAVTVAAVATTQEELSSAGAKTSTFSFDPQVAIVVDMTMATDHPDCDKKQYGDIPLGGGPVLTRGSANSPVIYKMLTEIAEREGIAYSFEPAPHHTGTDADVIYSTRGGVATALVSIPCRYLHSPIEMVELSDIENTVKLIVSFIRSLSPDMDFIPH